MTFVGRNVDSGARIGLGAQVSNENEKPRLAILCTAEGLSATFDTGIEVRSISSAMAVPVSVSADGQAFDPFPVTAELIPSDDHQELRLRLGAAESQGLIEYVLGAEQTISLRHQSEAGNVEIEFPRAGAEIVLGAVISECDGRKSK